MTEMEAMMLDVELLQTLFDSGREHTSYWLAVLNDLERWIRYAMDA